jgi:hypothetical protein
MGDNDANSSGSDCGGWTYLSTDGTMKIKFSADEYRELAGEEVEFDPDDVRVPQELMLTVGVDEEVEKLQKNKKKKR